MTLVLPGPEDRTVIIGQTGSGKTIQAGWLLSKQNFKARPWVALDFKDEILWDMVGTPPMRRLSVHDMPGKRGLYRMRVSPWDEDAVEKFLIKVWERGNIGLICDEASLLPKKEAFKAILRQGRSKLIPVIACSQRPVDCDREVFSEAQYRSLFGIEDLHRDYPIIKGLFGGLDVRQPPPPFHSHWWDAKRRELSLLKPVPPPANVAASIRAVAPRSLWSSV